MAIFKTIVKSRGEEKERNILKIECREKISISTIARIIEKMIEEDFIILDNKKRIQIN